MTNPYSGYGPAQALRDTGSSLADIVKEFAGVKVAEARLGLEDKKLTMESDRIKAGLTKDIALGELAAATELAGIRRGTAQDVAAERHAKEMETTARMGAETQATLAKATIAHQQDLAKLAMAEDARKQKMHELEVTVKEGRLKEDTWENWVKKSRMPPIHKELILAHTAAEDLKAVIKGEDFEEYLKKQMENPRLTFDGLQITLGNKIEGIRKRIRQSKNEEEAAAIIEREYAPAMSHMMQMQMIRGEGPELSTKDQAEIMRHAAAIYNGDPGAFPGGIQSVYEDVARSITGYRQKLYSAKDPSSEEMMKEIHETTAKRSGETAFMKKVDELELLKDNLASAGKNFDKIKEKAGEKAKAGQMNEAMKMIEDNLKLAREKKTVKPAEKTREEEGGEALGPMLIRAPRGTKAPGPSRPPMSLSEMAQEFKKGLRGY